MYFTLETDYALRIVDFLAHSPGRSGAQLISEETSVTLRFSLKILRKLVGCGIVRSYKGAQGGYEIARPLDKISVADVVAAIEGQYIISRCLAEGNNCYRAGGCPYHSLFDEISHDVRKKLEKVTMQDVMDDIRREQQ